MVKLKRPVTPEPGPGELGKPLARIGDPRLALTVEILPAQEYFLVAGVDADVRLMGWARRAQAETVTDDAAWQAHGDRLVAAAATHGFEPFYMRKHRPSGAGFERWKAAFLNTYAY